MSLMASPSSFPSCNYKFNVFTSFHGPDVRKTLLSHMRKQFNYNGITMFDDQGIERSATIAPSLEKAIRESRISIVILSTRYASSSWCLDELVEVLNCKKAMEHIVMTIFYGVEPFDVRNQAGEFGIAFSETCERNVDEERQKWSKALNEVGNIAGEDFLRWGNEADMIEKIARDVLDKLNATPSRDFDGMVGLEAHLREMQSLLDLDYDGVKIVGITGPAGIGKTTIARALHSRLSNSFQLTCFMENIKCIYYSGLDEYGLKLCLQEQLLSKTLNQNGMRICHLGLIQERLSDQKVLIILDDVNNLKQLKALAGDISWFGPGSRIIVATENKELLERHNIADTHHVDFPSKKEAIEILCRYAFRKKSMNHGFEELAKRVTKLCDNLPLGLGVVGSSLLGKNKDEWEYVIRRLETILDHQDIEEVLRVGYESLHENEQSLFLHIAVFFNYKDGDLVKAMFASNNLDTKQGLKTLADKSLIYISTVGEIVMHKLLQQVGRQAIYRQEPWKRRILIDATEICDILELEGTRGVSGISLDTYGIDDVYLGKGAFKRMPNLRFLKVYKSRVEEIDRMYIHEEMEFPRRLRLLHWEAYPSKCLPSTFHPEYLVEHDLKNSQLKYLWQGIQPLTNLKKMNLSASYHLKELPDLSNATNLETLNMSYCESLVEIPSSFSHLHKLQNLLMSECKSLQVIPAHMNLASLEIVNMKGCSRLTNIPVMSTNIKQLSRILKDTVRIPDCIKALDGLQSHYRHGCRRLTSLPELPSSLIFLEADDCESLETVFFPLNSSKTHLNFTNCFKLGQQARRAIIQRSFRYGAALLPGREVPSEFDHRGNGSSLTIRPDGNHYTGFVVCVVISLSQRITDGYSELLCRRIGQQDLDKEIYVGTLLNFQTEHLFIFYSGWLFIDPSDMTREISFEFSSKRHNFDVIKCGAKILTDLSNQGSYATGSGQITEIDTEVEPFEDNN
ncbi:disease resistance protein RML1B-like [Capsella rubella]|uniref:disease resistance protein RML1B-like n=1 Tax=Capsella rubella TaxID=81985 RepID=UPI000CD4DCE5|nr:disease resistance protein RML1B-like [Capsella rubella]